MTARWKVCIEVRREGALGLFEHREFFVEAEDRRGAVHATIDAAHAQGLEPRSVRYAGVES